MTALPPQPNFPSTPTYVIPVADDFVRRQSDQREDGLRRAAFHPDAFDRLKYTITARESTAPPSE
ncbi:MAG: hypothetical protein ACQESR_16425 [Planctomycetota bacterium]